MIHFDDFPILFFGKNLFKNWIIGSFICENEEDNTLQYFHSIVKSELLKLFLQQQITYFDLLQKVEKIYFVNKNYSDRIINAISVEYQSIDKSILPLKNLFCPISIDIATVFSKTEYHFSRLLNQNVFNNKIFCEKTLRNKNIKVSKKIDSVK